MTLTPLADGLRFGQAPCWFEGLLWFCDTFAEAVHTVTLDGRRTTLPLRGHAPSGLAFRPDGSLLIVSSARRQVLAYDGDSVVVVADLSRCAPADLCDIAVDRRGYAYVSSPHRNRGVIVRVDPDDGGAAVVADGLEGPGGLAIAAGGSTLMVAESAGCRLSALTVADDGTLLGSRTFADRLDGPLGGICLDDDGAVWVAMTRAGRFQRVHDNGQVTDRIDLGGRSAVACTLGGPEGRTLFTVSCAFTVSSAFTVSCAGAHSDRPGLTALSRIEATTVDVPAAGFAPQPHLH